MRTRTYPHGRVGNRPFGPRITHSPRTSALRSLVKSLTYRGVATVYTISLAMFVFGKIEMAAAFGVIDLFLNTLIYFGHERLWAWIDLRQKVANK